MSWNYGDLFDQLDAAYPGDAPALIHGDRIVPWRDFARRSNALAAALCARGVAPGDKVAFYTRNCPEYMETLVACFKARLVHVNVNFRYLDDELAYIFDNSDAVAVVLAGEFADRVDALRGRLPGVRHWIQIDGEPAEWAESYTAMVEEGDGAPLDLERSPHDLLFVYTGGTTGKPKGVMWRAEDLWGALGYGANAPANRRRRPASVEEHVANVVAWGPRSRQIPACPLMHGTGMLSAIGTLSAGGAVVTMGGEKFDPVELFDTVERHRADSVVIVGDAFAKPMLNALDAEPGRWELSSLKLILSSGVIWSREVKRGLLEHHPGLLLVDAFGSSEAVGFGTSVTTASGETRTARFQIGERCKVFTEDHREVEPGSGETGFIARCGPIPTGYYKDPVKSAETFPTIAGVRYSIPGDCCRVEADGTLTLLGRGSVCINTGGEKVYPEEVEEALKTHADVEDALVVGLPDEKWGQAVTGVVQLAKGAVLREEALRDHVKQQLAAYKTPKRIVTIDKMQRAPNGKADYPGVTDYAKKALGV
ncbi:MAG: acyl-CoA synthetase [Proteobacteria bacterium]|nr:acyl-CoA synthetase [Pseudomonadota bacterium]MCZ6782069.1 acyl-CoA synthetase [Pseudomonadota bacterium]